MRTQPISSWSQTRSVASTRLFRRPIATDPSPSSEALRAADGGRLRDEIARVALAAGADAVRFTSAASDDPTALRLADAIARGDLATWPYDERFAGRASRPGALLANARSIVCLAVRYDDGGAPPLRMRARGDEGRVSIYAHGDDYHRAMQRLARDVAASIERIAGGARGEAVTFVACDTAPIAERAFAARAGLGWIGKHTNLIAPGLGSYVFLAEIVTTLELEPDLPRVTHCGSCSRCVTACPTGALRGDYTMDATRCISDLTQRTDAIPREMRPLIGTWVWGCDLCQDVCPPTLLTRSAAVAPHERERELDLVELLELRSGAFKRRYRGTAMGWRGAAILRRNAAVALGNALDRAAVPALERALGGDPHPLVRGHAAWALGRIGSPRAYVALGRRADGEADAAVREEIAAALASAGKPPRPVAR